MTIRLIFISSPTPASQSSSSSTTEHRTLPTIANTTIQQQTANVLTSAELIVPKAIETTTSTTNTIVNRPTRIPVITANITGSKSIINDNRSSSLIIVGKPSALETSNSAIVNTNNKMTGESIKESTNANISFQNTDTQIHHSSSPSLASTISPQSCSLSTSLTNDGQPQSQPQQPQSHSQLNDYEFDGTTVLCRVCGDKASGFHYGVHSCEGCKGFFRRSIQQKIQYRPCTKNQQCSILRINRNRCQYCRLKKCIAVGMSRDAVRFGRVPKREKAKILAAMQKVNAHSLEKALAVVLEDEMNLMQSIIKAHEETCDYTKDKVAPLLEAARSRPIYAQCPQMTCPLNPSPVTSILENGSNGTNRLMEDFSERFSPAIHGVVEFAKRIPGFSMLAQEDQVTLLKAGVFEVLLVRLACMFDSQTNSMVCLNGLSLRRDSLHSASNARFLLDSMFDFAERLNSLRLTDQEIGLFCAVVVIAPDRPGLRNTDLVQKINKRLEEVLQKAISSNHNHHNFVHNNDSTALFLELTKKIPDLRTLNALHSEKLLGKSFGVFDSASPSSPNASNGNQRMDTLHPQQNGISTTTGNMVNSQPSQQQQPDSQSDSPDRWSSTSSTSSLLMISHSFSPNSTNSVDDNVHCPRSISPPNLNQHDLWMVDSKDNIAGVTNGNFGSPRSISSSVSSDDNNSNGLSRKGSISSSSSSSSSSPLAPKLTYMNNYARVLNSNNTSGSLVASVSNNSEQTSIIMNHHQDHESLAASNLHQYNKSSTTRVDSPTDSGIESGKERDGNASTPTTSVCSSPQSAIEENNNRMMLKDSLSTTMSDSETGSEKQESIDDMPVLKRALQAPPLVNTNKLMDEAYRYHKKFRAARSRDTEPHSPTTTTTNYKTSVISSTPTGVITSHSSLASTHSTLLKTLEQPSRYMNEQQLKRTDLIHNIIMNTEAVQTPATTAPSIMMILKEHSSSSPSAAVQQFNSHHQQYSDNHNQSQLIYSSSPSLGLPAKMEHQKDGQQVAVLYTASTQHSSSYNNDNVSTGSGCPFSSGRIVSNPLLAHNQQQHSIYRTSLSPQSYLIEQQNNQQTQPLLVIGSTPPTAAAPAHSPARPSSSSSCYSNGGNQSPYCHLVQRCYTATIAPSLASNGPIMLQTAASSNNHQSGPIVTMNEPDCQPLNLSKKAASANTNSRSQSPSYSFSSLNPNTASRTGTSISCSPLIKIEVDQNA